MLAGVGIFWWHHRAAYDTTSTQATAVKELAEGSDARPSIAVLPFENRSAKQDDAFFVDGVHDDILTQLSKVGALKVISRTSVERFRNTRLSIREIAQQLGVTSILEGGVQRGGARVRVNLQLIDATSDAHLWAESYDRELTAENIFAIQSEVAAAIAIALKTQLTPAEEVRVASVPTRNLEAWEAYQIAKQRMATRTVQGLEDAAIRRTAGPWRCCTWICWTTRESSAGSLERQRTMPRRTTSIGWSQSTTFTWGTRRLR